MSRSILLLLCTLGLAYGLFVDELLYEYDFRQSPKEAGFSPATVRVGFYFNSLRFDTGATDNGPPVLTAKAYVRQGWQDGRLRFPYNLDTKVNVHPSDMDKFWRPDTFFRNAIGVSRFKQPNPQQLMRINSTGDVWYVESLRITVPCSSGPTITCNLFVESYAYLTDDLSFVWMDNPVQVDTDNVHLPGYTLTDHVLKDCTTTLSPGTFPCLQIKLVFEEV